MQLTTADGVSLHFEVQGPSDGPAVLFANSPGTHLGLWDGIVELMPRGYRLVRMDKRGHGLSTCPPGPYSIAGLADDCSTILDHLGIRRSVFVGLSIGGLVGQELALTRPGLVRALVLANSGVRIGNRAMWRERIGLARAGKLGDMADAVIKRWFSARFRSCHPGRVEAWRTDLVRVPGEGYAGCCEAIMGADFSESAGWILQPTLVIAGSEDEATPVRLAEQATSLIPGSRLAVIECAGHLSCVDSTPAFAAHLGEFLQMVEASGAD